MNEIRPANHQAAMILVSACGEPVMLVPAPTLAEARERAITLLRAGPGDKIAIGKSGCSVTLFVPAVEAGGEVLGYQPVGSGHSHTPSG